VNTSDPARRPWAGFADALGAAGLDLVQPFIASEEVAALVNPVFGLEEGSLACIVGNTKALWSPFCAAYATRGKLSKARDPLDCYVEEQLENARAEFVPKAQLWLGHRRYRGQFAPLVRLSESSGLSHRAPTGLGIHEHHGKWFALRALLVLPDRAPAEIAKPSPPSPCDGCPAPCLTARDHAARLGSIASHPDAWLEVRRVCPVGREAAYSRSQALYHYTKNANHIKDI
jgi:hypothetical protein